MARADFGGRPPQWLRWPDMTQCLPASPNPNLLLAPLTLQEAVMSSRIEGTQATLWRMYWGLKPDRYPIRQPAVTIFRKC